MPTSLTSSHTEDDAWAALSVRLCRDYPHLPVVAVIRALRRTRAAMPPGEADLAVAEARARHELDDARPVLSGGRTVALRRPWRLLRMPRPL